MSDSLAPYPWNPWVEVGGKLYCQFCASADSQNMGHKEHCTWLKRWSDVHGTTSNPRVLLQEDSNRRG